LPPPARPGIQTDALSLQVEAFPFKAALPYKALRSGLVI
jgi:hypothetical protein